MEIKEINYKETWPIRHKVMWPEEKLDYIKLKDDAQGIHFGAYYNDLLVSVISLFIDNDEAQFRKFATLNDFQGKGIGSDLLKHTISYCIHNKIKRLFCNARLEKVDFYKRFGLVETDEVFCKKGTNYVIMEIILNFNINSDL